MLPARQGPSTWWHGRRVIVAMLILDILVFLGTPSYSSLAYLEIETNTSWEFQELLSKKKNPSESLQVYTHTNGSSANTYCDWQHQKPGSLHWVLNWMLFRILMLLRHDDTITGLTAVPHELMNWLPHMRSLYDPLWLYGWLLDYQPTSIWGIQNG